MNCDVDGDFFMIGVYVMGIGWNVSWVWIGCGLFFFCVNWVFELVY